MITARSRLSATVAALMAVVPGLMLSGCSAGDETSTVLSPRNDATATPVEEPAAATPEPPVPTTTPLPAAVSTATPTPVPTATPAPVFRTGAEVLADAGFDVLRGRRVGLIANQTSLVDGQPLIDLLQADPDVDLVALFAPEHGPRGDLGAGELVADGIDAASGLPVLSLYGATRTPTAEMLTGIDVLVHDLQDVGTRFYTYISTMGLAMSAAAEAGVDFVVLDRPNPQGGAIVEGFVRTPDQESFISQYPIPATYGLTSGELAAMIKGERWLPGVAALSLSVVPLKDWDGRPTWDGLDREWVAPSPGLPSITTARVYPGTVLFEATTISYGQGTDHTFAQVGAPWANGAELAAELNAAGLAGVRFDAVDFVPTPDERAPSPRLEGQQLSGVRVVVANDATFAPVATGVHLLVAFDRASRTAGLGSIVDRPRVFDLLAGTTQLRELLDQGTGAPAIVAAWNADATDFDTLRQRYLLHD